jgi:hypothetical protein
MTEENKKTCGTCGYRDGSKQEDRFGGVPCLKNLERTPTTDGLPCEHFKEKEKVATLDTSYNPHAQPDAFLLLEKRLQKIERGFENRLAEIITRLAEEGICIGTRPIMFFLDIQLLGKKKWVCNKCKKPHETDGEAEACYHSHKERVEDMNKITVTGCHNCPAFDRNLMAIEEKCLATGIVFKERWSTEYPRKPGTSAVGIFHHTCPLKNGEVALVIEKGDVKEVKRVAKEGGK